MNRIQCNFFKFQILKAELSMFEDQVSDLKLDVEYKQKELAEFKTKFFSMVSLFRFIEKKLKVVNRNGGSKNCVNGSGKWSGTAHSCRCWTQRPGRNSWAAVSI